MRKFIYKVLVFLNVLLVLPLFFAYLSIYVSPDTLWPLAFFGLAYPYFLVLNFIFILFWMYHKKWILLFSLFSILIGWNFLGQTFQLNFNTPEYVSGNEFKLLSYNVRVFDKYNWTKDNHTSDKLADFIEEENADLICLQEVPGGKIKGKTYKSLLKNVLKNKKYHFASQKAGKSGVLTISKFPILKKGEIRFASTGNISTWTDIKIDNDTLRVFNLHLQSIHLDPSSYKLLDTLDMNAQERNIREAEDIVGHLKDAYISRSKQAEEVAVHIAESPYKVVVCGDFNDQPVSYSYHQISNGLCDAFRQTGRGISNTYIGKFPSFRIDYILHSEEIISADYTVTHVKLSDHYPISCKLILK